MKRRRSAGARSSWQEGRNRREARFVRAVLARLDDDLAAGRLTSPAELHDRVMASLAEAATPGLAGAPHRVGRLIDRVLARALPASVESLIGAADKTRESRLAVDVGERTRFEQRLQHRWGAAVDTLALFRIWCLEAGIAFHDRRKPADGDWVYAVLVRLQARACLVAAEVLALLRAGFASGAHARWRAGHEIAVVGFLIKQHGQDAAERFLLHEAVESYRAAAEYQRYATKIGYDPFTDQELAEMRAGRDALVARFGSSYAGPYGWAANALQNPRPTFRDIEAAVSLDHMRPHYRWASHPTHAGPKSTSTDLGLLRNEVMLAGPSNAGLADPGHGSAISLLQITVTLLNTNPDMGDVVTMTFLQGACDAVGEAFISAHRQLVADDAALVRGDSVAQARDY
jgi:hypothetical protein